MWFGYVNKLKIFPVLFVGMHCLFFILKSLSILYLQLMIMQSASIVTTQVMEIRLKFRIDKKPTFN